ncbi:MAG: LysR family transcriptional regulator [Mesorhizobium sp.]|nr:MAG: LysR family transcriptional regulator [Mesorhizobium sp.]
MPDIALDFRLFQYALAAAEHGSFRRAAAALNVEQSTVSRGVRSLEHRVGAELFERGHAGIRPTPAGERFLEEAILGFDHLRRAMQRIGASQRGVHGQLTVAISAPFIVVSDLFEQFRGAYEGIAIEVVEASSNASWALTQQRNVDVAFVAKIREGTPRTFHLRDERMVAVLPKSHPLAAARKLSLNDLRLENLILGEGSLGPDIEEHLAGAWQSWVQSPRFSCTASTDPISSIWWPRDLALQSLLGFPRAPLQPAWRSCRLPAGTSCRSTQRGWSAIPIPR